jgi:signal transduction histidine kinase
MNSIVTRLTLAFVFVGLAGALLVAVLLRQRTRAELDLLVQNQNKETLIAALSEYYQANAGWHDLTPESLRGYLPMNLAGSLPPGDRRSLFQIADAQGVLIFGVEPNRRGQATTRRELDRADPILVAGETVGYLISPRSLYTWNPDTPESDFLRSINRAILLSALVAALLALVLGGMLAYTLTRQLRELTAATQRVAAGQLGHQVQIRSHDEMGTLAAAFNQMSADLQHANNLRQQMTADIAHDLRTPLSVILGYSEALADGKLAPEPETLAVMHTEAQHLSRLIEDLKVIALADAGELPLAQQHITPQVLLRQAAEAQRVQASQQEIQLQVDLPENLPPVLVDADRMAQVLGNLLNNALRYTPPGGTIILRARQEAGQVLLQVADSGPGIPPEALADVFERTYRGDPARHQTAGETGLGLAIARSLVMAQGGVITVESPPGQGATFTIRLPVAA